MEFVWAIDVHPATVPRYPLASEQGATPPPGQRKEGEASASPLLLAQNPRHQVVDFLCYPLREGDEADSNPQDQEEDCPNFQPLNRR